MSEPTIRIASCRDDGKCPECSGQAWTHYGFEPIWALACGCWSCSAWPCHDLHTQHLLAEAIRQRDIVAKTQKRDLNESIEVIQDLHVKLDKAREELADQQRASVKELEDTARIYATNADHWRGKTERANEVLRETLIQMDQCEPCPDCAGCCNAAKWGLLKIRETLADTEK